MKQKRVRFRHAARAPDGNDAVEIHRDRIVVTVVRRYSTCANLAAATASGRWPASRHCPAAPGRSATASRWSRGAVRKSVAVIACPTAPESSRTATLMGNCVSNSRDFSGNFVLTLLEQEHAATADRSASIPECPTAYPPAAAGQSKRTRNPIRRLLSGSLMWATMRKRSRNWTVHRSVGSPTLWSVIR